MLDLLQGIVTMTTSSATMHLGWKRRKQTPRREDYFLVICCALVPGACSVNRKNQEWCNPTTWIVWSWRLA